MHAKQHLTDLGKGLAAIALALVLCLLAPASALRANPPDVAAGWRDLFRRPPAPALDAGRVALGARLFGDTRLSGTGARSCATCHRPELAFTDGRARALGLSGRPLARNTPALWNLAWGKHYFWDGRAASLEAQARGPIEAAGEMGGDWAVVLQRLGHDQALAAQFARAFPDRPAITDATILEALAAYVRSLVSPATRFDAWIAGAPDALDAAELRGYGLFIGKAGCALCHAGWRFTDDRFHDIGLRGSRDPGRGDVPGGTRGLAAFKTPGLRELVHTAPYMHDGSLPTLAAVLDHYAGGFVKRPALSANMRRDLRLGAREKAELVAFLKTLSGERHPARPTRGADP